MANKCPTCGKTVYFAEEAKAIGKSFHRRCLKCAQCNKALDPGSLNDRDGKIYCKGCYNSVAGLKGFRGGGGGINVIASVTGGATGLATFADNSNTVESALQKGYTTGYRQAGDVAGPTSAHTNTVMTEDTGIYVGASATATTGYRQAGDVAGPTSAHTNTVMTEDTGIYAGTTGSATTGFAVAAAAAGP